MPSAIMVVDMACTKAKIGSL